MPRYRLFIDGWCAYCRRSARVLRALDWTGGLEILSFRTSEAYREHGLTSADLEQRMYLVELATGARFAGFDALVKLARTLPLLMPSVPVLWLLHAIGLGPRFYDWLAARRLIVPDPPFCEVPDESERR